MSIAFSFWLATPEAGNNLGGQGGGPNVNIDANVFFPLRGHVACEIHSDPSQTTAKLRATQRTAKLRATQTTAKLRATQTTAKLRATQTTAKLRATP